MKKIVSLLIVVTSVLVISVPRFYNLGTQPPGLHIDEVSFAADAKSIAETGKDTWGEAFPRVFKAFGEWKAPGLTYSMAFWSLVTGTMNNFVARLPSALAGIVSIIMLVLTVRTLYPALHIYIISTIALILAFSPWHFDMSRIFYEAFSAMSWLSVSLYYATRRLMLGSKVKKHEWFLLIATAAIAGYYYASIRYVVIAYVVLISALCAPSLKKGVRPAITALLILIIIGAGWVTDLFSQVGLNRLHYYQQKANLGASLQIDEKRQFCYLSLDRDADAAKSCYALWNKPVAKVMGAGETVLTYLGTDFLFVKGESEYGFDSEYGAYLLPVSILYLMGIWHVMRGVGQYLTARVKGKDGTSLDKTYVLYVSLAILSLMPAAAALNLNMRMAMVSLYIIGLISSIGLVEIVSWLQSSVKPLIRIGLYCLYGGVVAFYSLQATIHYFFVFTHSNDLQWTSDAGTIFNYVKSVSGQYDRIVDTELHGPLAPYFYGDVSTQDVHTGEYSPPDDIGFTYLIKAGKYELKHINIKDLACEVVSKGDTRRTLVISNPYPELLSMRKFASHSWNEALLLHEVYDLQDIIKHMERSEPTFRSRCGQK